MINNKDYNFKFFEKKWQEEWQKAKIFEFEYNQQKPTSYVLEMLYYPSGKIHMGHVRNYSIGDVIARYKRAKGFNVLHPMGADAFGLPAENAAIQNKVHPKKWTYENIDAMNTQLKALGFSYNWDGFVTTCDPEYYKHEQKMFIEFFKKGLAYQKESIVNWDPVDQTVLANEQVIDGKGWRSGALVEKRALKQWFLKISNYSQELLDCLEKLPNWPEKVKKMQQNWIGRSEGAEIMFQIKDSEDKIVAFSTRPETIFGATFVAISTEHSIAKKLAEKDEKIKIFAEQTANEMKANYGECKEKAGINSGIVCINPITKEEMPVYIANFVLMEYGTGALFGCPAHDERDFEFAKKYNLPIKNVIDEEGKMQNSSFLNGINPKEARQIIIKKLEEEKSGIKKVNYKLKDWGVSRQRYWGCPIPMVYCADCGVVHEKDENLPVKLPDDVQFDGNGNPLANHPTWKNCKCPKCGKNATRETDTLDTFFESSWYHLRYITPHLVEKAFDEKLIEKMIPVDYYIGGIEHAILHMLYARFFLKALRDCGYFSKESQISEPFNNFMTQDSEGNWVEPNDLIAKDGKIFNKNNSLEVFAQGVEKMSKSKKNIVDPSYIMSKYGADAARMLMLSDSPYDKEIEWTDKGASSILKYLQRIWSLLQSMKECNVFEDNLTESQELKNRLNIFLKQYTSCIEKNEFNVAIAKMREFTNFLEKFEIAKTNQETLNELIKSFAIAISPIIPHFAETIWADFSFKGFVSQAQWPEIDQNCKIDSATKIAIQINGKLRDAIEIKDDNIDENEIKKLALSLESIKKYISHQEMVKKVIYIKNKVINFII
jgi:leucyl-tRNA synthetase